MWAVVHFTADNSVDFVPSSWIRKNGIKMLCGWPKNDSNLKNFRSNRLHPNKQEFTYYSCRVISKDIASLSEAQIKAEKAQFTSDVSDVDNYTKKPKALKSLNNSTAAVFQKKSSLVPGYSSEYVDANCLMAKKDDGFKLNDSDEFSENLSTIDDSDVDKDYIPLNKDKEQNITEIWLTKDSEVNYLSMDGEDIQNNKPDVSTSFETHNNCDTHTLSQSKSLQSTNIEPVNSQSFIGSASDQHWEHEVDYFIHNWPISTKEGLMNMEEKIKLDVNFKKQVVWELARVGGKSLKSMIYKIMKKVFDDQVLISYTFYGLRSKENFSLLGINKAIFLILCTLIDM